MNKKQKLLSTVVATVMLSSVCFTGCDLQSSNNLKDMDQVIARVNITKNEEVFEKEAKKDSIKNPAQYKNVISDTDGITEITKRDLISYYLSANASSNGYSIATLVNSLVSNALISQYAIIYLLNENESVSVTDYLAKNTVSERYSLLLGDNSKYENLAFYQLFSSINNTLDSYEKQYLEKDEDNNSATETRTTPGNVDAEQEDYYPAKADGVSLNYKLYTGFGQYNLASVEGTEYEPLEGSTNATRRRAYADFVQALYTNNMVKATDDMKDVMDLTYTKTQSERALQSAVISKYYDIVEEKNANSILGTSEDVYQYVDTVYHSLVKDQKASVADDSTFETAMGNLSDSSFIVYSPEVTETEEEGYTYGYVYNILLPFDAQQTIALSSLNNNFSAGLITQNDYFNGRAQLMQAIKTVDQRTAWFNGSKVYAFDASEKSLNFYQSGNNSQYLFFENNMTDSTRYESLDKYLGLYPYNGTVSMNKDDSYSLTPNKLTINNMLNEMVAYVNYALGKNAASWQLDNRYNTTTYFDDVNHNNKVDGDEKIDYSKFVYATGKVDFGSESSSDFLTKSSDSYKALSAVNELQYAYTTDTGVLSQYVGYSVSAHKTNYIKEFEYAAQQAVKSGAGTFYVCAGDYGWHIIYVTYTFNVNGGEVYQPNWVANIEQEGTFENRFYEWLKDSQLSDVSSVRGNLMIQRLTNNKNVTKYENTYADLTALDSNR